jgi:energy-coupling factor transport system ATP-binding protein
VLHTDFLECCGGNEVETYTIRNLTFTYPGGGAPALDGINLSLRRGELVVLCGKSGCGKTTLLRNLKTVLSPFGQRTGEIFFDGRALETVDQREQAGRIGYVLQNPDNQLVTDKVWHELAFGLENLGVDTKTIRVRVAEMASFFGIQTWFDKNVTELSGGQKQILNLAAVMVMQPDVLVLDEPTSQLDPIAAGEFLDTVRKVNREIGTTVIMTEHRLDEILPLADRAVVMDNGKILVDDIPANAGAVLAQMQHHMFEGMPAPLQAYAMVYSEGYGRQLPCPVDVGEGRTWLTGLFDGALPQIREIPAIDEPDHRGETPVVELSDVWYRYARDDKDVVKGLSMKVYPGEIFCIVGGNGTGKTTALSLISGLRKPVRGKVRISLPSKTDGNHIIKKNIPLGGTRLGHHIGVLPQNAQAIFVEKTIGADLMEVLLDKNLPHDQMSEQVRLVAELVEIDHLLHSHPYDVSGGEQQRAALAKILLLNPQIILLDEPTKGIDNHFKNKLAEILRKCAEAGATVIMVSHDIEFCGKYADRCAMFFDGAISTTNAPRKFFSGNSFYTTASNRMSRHIFRNAVTPKDVADLCIANLDPDGDKGPDQNAPKASDGQKPGSPYPGGNMAGTSRVAESKSSGTFGATLETIARSKKLRWTITGLLWLCMPLTIYLGIRMPGESGYLVSSLLLIFYIMIPFFLSFERRKPQAREVVLIAVMIALAVASRAAFFMVPQFKPMLAVIIIAGVCLGAQSGFLVGSMSAFVSNFLFGQGPWTPFQMLAWGLIGFVAGLLVANLLKGKHPVALSIYGFFAVFLIHGGITDLWTLLGMSAKPTFAMVLTVYGTGLIFNMILAVATVIFLLLLAKPMIEKIERVQLKYGLLDQ